MEERCPGGHCLFSMSAAPPVLSIELDITGEDLSFPNEPPQGLVLIRFIATGAIGTR